MNELIKALRSYGITYREPPYGREVEGTPELLEKAANAIQKAMELMEEAAETIENCYGQETDLSERIKNELKY